MIYLDRYAIIGSHFFIYKRQIINTIMTVTPFKALTSICIICYGFV